MIKPSWLLTILFIISGVFFAFSCKTVSPVSYVVSKDILEIKEAFIQEEVAGTKDEDSKYYIVVQFVNFKTEETSVDSIAIIAAETLVVRNLQFNKYENTIRKRIENSIANFTVTNGKPLKLKIYFKKDNLAYCQNVQPLLVKEKIYLP